MENQKFTNIMLKVEGMTCSHCNQSVEGNFRKINGVAEANTDHKEGKAEVKYIEGETCIQEIIDSFNKLGHYRASLPESEK